MPTPPRFSLRRAVLLGACLSCLVGGSWTVGTGRRGLKGDVDCSDQSAEACALERDVRVGIARRQVVAGAALVLLGVALLFPLREAHRARS
ncbi:MAG: hypothetical protein L0Y64_04330 [Myxococcaceae bacterium]|nr:hypothetical protein [Myxococcaceae bacterium]